MTTNRDAMTLERQAFEDWYTTHAFDYSRDPIGSRDCSLQWEAWQAALAHLSRAAEPVDSVPCPKCGAPCSYSEHEEPFGFVRKWAYTHPSEDARDARDTRTALDDALQFGTGFTVDGKRIDPARVVIYHGHPKDDAAMAQESGE